MKSLTKKEFEHECHKLQFRGKCSVLFHKKTSQNLNKVSLFYKNDTLLNSELLEIIINKYTSAVLINFEISLEFPFYKIENIMHQLLAYIPNNLDLVITATYIDTKNIQEADITVISSKQSKFNLFLSKIFKQNIVI